MGIEPTSEAWEASILPLYDARSNAINSNRSPGEKQQEGPPPTVHPAPRLTV
jgi:hypothetical protein